jgi:uncharacterized protein YsxB (DUF464 family)
MIRIYAVEDTLDDEGCSTLIMTGHGSEDAEGDLACRGASTLWFTMCLGFEDMAKSYPDQVSFQKIEKKSQEAVGTLETPA